MPGPFTSGSPRISGDVPVPRDPAGTELCGDRSILVADHDACVPAPRGSVTRRRLEAPDHGTEPAREVDGRAILEIRPDDLDADRQPARRPADRRGDAGEVGHADQ